MHHSSYKVKSVILGSPENLKTRLLRNISSSYFQRCYKNIVGVDIGVTEVRTNNSTIILSFWDCLCASRTDFFRNGFYKGSEGAIICYNSKNNQMAERFIDEFREYSNKKLPILHIFIKEEEQARDHLNIEKNSLIFNDLNDAIDWLARTMIHYHEGELNGYLEISTSDLPEIILPPDVSHDVSHPKILSSILEGMGFIVSNQNCVNILKENALFSVNLIDASIIVYPLICDSCKNDSCKDDWKKEKNLCIVLNSRGWSTMPDLSQKDLLILSKIYALANFSFKDDEFPAEIKDQIEKVISCSKFKK